MSTIQIGIPAAYPWVLAVASATPFLTMWQASLITPARKAAKVDYPHQFASKEEEERNPAARKFNCVQRSHQNTLETYPHLILSLLLGGLVAPRVAVALGVANIIGRVMYTLGYSTGEPKKRAPGFMVVILSLFGLFGTAAFSSYKLLEQTKFHF